jgi:hypothetical protein
VRNYMNSICGECEEKRWQEHKNCKARFKCEAALPFLRESFPCSSLHWPVLENIAICYTYNSIVTCQSDRYFFNGSATSRHQRACRRSTLWFFRNLPMKKETWFTACAKVLCYHRSIKKGERESEFVQSESQSLLRPVEHQQPVPPALTRLPVVQRQHDPVARAP